MKNPTNIYSNNNKFNENNIYDKNKSIELKMNEKIAIAWTDLTFKVQSIWTKKSKIILNDVNGSVSFGTLNALMGPSGAGKTTLMKCINGKLKSGLSHRSKIFLSSHEKIRSCLIGQNQNQQLIRGLTAKQNLIYASKLKNSDNDFYVDHQKNVNNLLLELMSKTDIANTKVDDCSGGEQRRITIALELTNYIKPNLICIDEPTSGLDSNAAEMVIEYLRLLSRKHNISIITSIHQPNSEALMMFDKLYVLAKGGVCVYSGAPNHLEVHLNHCQIQCTEFQVPIEVMLKIATKGSNDKQVMKLSKKTSEDNKQLLFDKCRSETKLYPNGIPFRSKCFNLYDMWYLLLRTMTDTYVSHWKTLLIQILFYIFCPLIIAKTVNQNIGRPDGCFEYTFRTNKSCFNQLEEDSLLDQNIKFQAFTSVLVMFIQICTTTLTFTSDVKIFMNEHQNRWYSTGSYYLAKNVVEIIPTILFSICYAFINYYISGQISGPPHRMFWYTFIIIFGMLCSQGFGYLIGIICIKCEQIAIGVSIGLYLMLCMFCNIFTPLNEMPQIFQIISDISFNKFVYYSVLIIIYGFNRCPSGQLSIVMHKYNMFDQHFYVYARYLVIYAISLRVLAFIVLYIKVNTFVNRAVILKLRNIMRKMHCFQTYLVPKSEPELLKVRKISTISNKSIYFIDSENLNYNDLDINLMDRKLSIAWMDLTLKNDKQFFMKEKTILRQLNGCIEIGTLTALMGPSGAGKTSLLRCLNGKYQSLMTEETKIYLSRYRNIKTCFISQDVSEHLINGLTAEQTLIYASKLKNSDKSVDHLTGVKNLMIDLLISDIANSFVQNCSTGEQKRLVMAMELTSVHKPNLICIDEPTTGLDSNAAEVVMKCLKILSRKHNISIITSIHQPNSDVLMLFDKLYVLGNGGVCVYSGAPQHLKQHLNECDINCSEIQVPIELLLKYACNGCEDKYVQKMMSRTDADKQCLTNRCRTETALCPEGMDTKSKRFSLIDLWFLLSRIITYTYSHYWKLILFKTIISLTFGYSLTLFFRKDIGGVSGCVSFTDDLSQNDCYKSETKLEEESLLLQNISFNFLVILLITFLQIVVTTMTFTLDVKIFLNEHRNGWYSTGCYYWAKSIEELIPTIITTLLYILIIDIYNEKQSIFIYYVYLLTIGILCVQSLGHIIAILFNGNQKIAVLFSVALYLLFFLLTNYFVPIKELHYSIQWLSNLSTFKLLFECILILFYGFNRCSGNQFSSVMFIFGFNDNQFYTNTRILLIKLIVLRVLALIVLLIKVNPCVRRKSSNELKVKTSDDMKKTFSTNESKIFIP